ncbi:AvrD family protein [Streptomyces sp. NPDC018057]|uniref:AvrD family protein n=1 Tax=unclassified Streptomyces TaxID=2593676 RepID=UPI0037A23826
MTEGTRRSDLDYRTIEDILGPSSQRYFGEGMAKVEQALRSIVFSADGSIRATGGISYPKDWSAKRSSGELRPHLSSIDAVVLAAQLIECHLGHVYGLTAEQRSRAWIRSVEARAGGEPTLDLAAIAVGCTVTGSNAQKNSLGDWLTSFECRVGSIKVGIQVEHDAGDTPPQPGAFDSPAGVLGETWNPYHGNGHKLGTRTIERVRLFPQDGTAQALATVSPAGRAEPLNGLGSWYAPALSLVDGIVISAQVAQALLYEVDGVSRDDTSTLWMRRFRAEQKTPHQPIGTPFICALSTTSSRLRDMRGAKWRMSDLNVRMLGVEGSFSLAHALPTTPAVADIAS